MLAALVLPSLPAAAAGPTTDYLVVYDSPAHVNRFSVASFGETRADLTDAGVLVVNSNNPNALSQLNGVTDVVQDGRHFQLPASDLQASPTSEEEIDSSSHCASTDDTCSQQWDLSRIHLPAAWKTTRGSAAIKVAVLDGGVYSGHEEIGSNYDQAHSRSFVQPSDFCPSDATTFASTQDFDGHGTWIATHIAGKTSNLMTGIAPKTTLLNVRVVGTCGFGDDSWILEGMMYAHQAGAQLINASLGALVCAKVVPASVYCSDPVQVKSDVAFSHAAAAVTRYLTAHGTLVIAAAGNYHAPIDGTGVLKGNGLTFGGVFAPDPSNLVTGLRQLPAGLPGVISVGATTRKTGTGAVGDTVFGQYGAGLSDQLALYSDYGSGVDIMAPGGARNFNLLARECKTADCARLGPSQPGASDNTGVYGAIGAVGTPCGATCYGYLVGTSQSTAQVTGVAALALAVNQDLSPDQLTRLLRRSVTDFKDDNATPPMSDNPSEPTFNYGIDFTAPPISNDQMGSGVIDAAKAVEAAEDSK
jgi:subtilisin family serine protease